MLKTADALDPRKVSPRAFRPAALLEGGPALTRVCEQAPRPGVYDVRAGAALRDGALVGPEPDRRCPEAEGPSAAPHLLPVGGGPARPRRAGRAAAGGGDRRDRALHRAAEGRDPRPLQGEREL